MISLATIQGGYPLRPLGDVVQFLDFRRMPVTASDRVGGPYPYYGANGVQDWVAGYIFDEPLVLLAEDGGHFEDPDRGIAYRISGKSWVNNHAHVLRPSEAVDGRYLSRVLENYDVRPFVTGTTRLKLTQAGAARIMIPVPPVEEQRRIADLLDRADALRAKRHEALAHLDSLTQSIFLDMFGDPVVNPQALPRRALWTLCGSTDDIRCGPFGTQLAQSEFRQAGVPLWGIKNVNNQFKTPTREFLDAQTADRLRRYSIQPGDIVMTRKGTVGNCAVYPPDFPVGIMHSDLLRLRVDEDLVFPEFLAHQLHHSRDVARQVTLISGGAIMPGINVGKLKQIEVLVPSHDQQLRFGARAREVSRAAMQGRRHVAEMHGLLASLRQRAFAGAL